jgi:hypothetical protein
MTQLPDLDGKEPLARSSGSFIYVNIRRPDIN